MIKRVLNSFDSIIDKLAIYGGIVEFEIIRNDKIIYLI